MFSDLLQIEFLRYAFIGAILSAAATSLISVFVSLKKVSYMGEAFSHISFAGIAFAFLVGLNPMLTTIVFVAFVAFLIAYMSKKYQLSEANITTIFLSVSMAFGIILISLNKKTTIDIESYLFGNILFVTKLDIIQLLCLFIINFCFIFLFFKELFYITYNQDIAKIYRIPVKPIYFIFIILMAVNIVTSIKIIGVVLIVAQLILPGISAINLCKNVKMAIFISLIISEIAAVSGLFCSYYLNIPSGAAIVVILFLLFLISVIFKTIKDKQKRVSIS